MQMYRVVPITKKRELVTQGQFIRGILRWSECAHYRT